MKNTTILVIIGIILVVAGTFIFINSEPDTNANVIIDKNQKEIIQGELQKVTLGIKDYNYYPNTIEVESGKPVEITLDNSVGGCYRSFVIRDLGINKYSRDPSQKITFTPTKSGTYTFACSMGMGYGKLIVK
ncbi:MAG: cupredoxin domain-containing protein [Candidatus Pacearchaeota archaeon]